MVADVTLSLVIRADGDERIGAGHVMRCLALAEAWRESGGRVSFVCRPGAEQLLERIARHGFELTRLPPNATHADDANGLIDRATADDAAWVVVDGYHFDNAYHARVRAAGRMLCVLDDGQRWSHPAADVVLNQNLGGETSRYSLRPGARLIAGPQFALVRPSFRRGATAGRPSGSARRLLVSLGGADPADATSRVLDALELTGNALDQVDVVVGPANPRREAIVRRAAALGSAVRVVVDPPDIAELMRTAEMAVIAAGSTLWEVAALGLPAVCIVVADNQAPLAQNMSEAGAVENAGPLESLDTAKLAETIRRLAADAAQRAQMAQRGRRLIDGRGAQRVVEHLRQSTVCLRDATPAESQLLWHWANDEATRAASFASSTIGWDEHVEWYERVLSDPATAMWIATDAAGRPLGQVRIERRGNTGLASFSIDPARRGQGWGTTVIGLAARRWLHENAAEQVIAQVKPANAASAQALRHAGFRETGTSTVAGQPAIEFVLTRELFG